MSSHGQRGTEQSRRTTRRPQPDELFVKTTQKSLRRKRGHFNGHLPNTFALFAGLLLSAALTSPAQQNVYGCPGQGQNSVFYARIDSLPVLAQSAAYTSNMGSSSLSWDTSWGVTLSNSSAPSFNAQFAYTPAYNGLWRYPPFYATDRENGSLGGSYGADHHTIVVDSDTCTVWETYHAYVNATNGAIETGHMCNGRPCNAQSGWKYDGNTYELPSQGTSDAAGLPLLPLLWRGHEIFDGMLQHPVRFTLARSFIQTGNAQWPASGGNGWGGKNTPPYGTRFRLKANAHIDLSGLTPEQHTYARTVVTALQRYGLVLADIGTNFNATVDDEAGQAPNIMAALGKVGGQITAAKIEAVDLSSLKPATPSYQVAKGLPTLPSVLVGTPYPTFLNILAGTTLQLKSWVNGPTSLKSVSWDVDAGDIGAVTRDGLYTPPASANDIEFGVLKATALADHTATATVHVRVLPSGPIRIAAGLRRGTMTDHLGHVWQSNYFFRAGDTVYRPGDYPGWATPNDPIQVAELPVYQSFSHTYGNDQVVHFFVPNGTYSVRLMFGQPYNGLRPWNCSPFPTKWHDHIGIEVQNTLVVKDYDFGTSINHACATPVDVRLPATVTNNELELALRNMVPDGSTDATSVMFNGLEIIRTK